jgi:hypothetical protein
VSERHVLSAPLDEATEGRLVIRHGLEHVQVGSDATMAELVTVRCTGRTPRVRWGGGTVELTYPLLGLVTRARTDEIILNGSVPWTIEINGAVGDVRADLSRVYVRSVDGKGGTTRLSLVLSQPDGTVPVRLGTVSRTVIRRPFGVPVRVRLRRGARRISVDDQTAAGIAGPTTLTSPGFEDATDRIDISVDIADQLTVTTSDLTETPPGRPRDVVLAATSWFARSGVSGVLRLAPERV